MTDNVIQFPNPTDLAERLKGIEFAEFIFTNDKENPFPQQILHTFYDAVLKNRVGVMHVKDATTGEVETVLVGVDLKEDGTADCFPLAKVLKHGEADNYLVPDGLGGYVGDTANVESA